MTEEELNFSKKMYEKIMKRNERLQNSKDELSILLQDDKVQRYIMLSNYISRSKELTEEEIIKEAFKNIKETSNSSNIFIPLIEKDKKYVRYIDLERIEIVDVLKEDSIEFEKNNIIIKINTTEKKFTTEFFKLRMYYFKEILSSDIEKAIQKIKKK